jgi:hypothetical protein
MLREQARLTRELQQATVNLYNNSKPTVLSIQAEGITTTGTPIVWNSKN